MENRKLDTGTVKFIPDGYLVISNSISIEIEFGDSGDTARCRYINSKDEAEVSEWLEIEYDIADEECSPTIYWDELKINLDEVMRINN